MPHIDKSISHITRYIISPISEQLVEKLLVYTGIHKSMFNNNVYFNNMAESADSFRHNDGRIKTTADNRLDVEVTPVFSLNETKNNMAISKFVHNWSHHAIFMDFPILYDKFHELSIVEFNTPVSVELALNMRFSSPDLADEVAFITNNKLSVAATATLADITFWYLFPRPILRAINQLHPLLKLKPGFDGKPMGLGEYLSKASNKQIDMVTNRHNHNKRELAVMRTYSKITGMFNYEGARPEVEMIGKRGDNYTVRFNFTYQFMCPSYLKLSYPIIIKNQYIPAELVPKKASDMFTEALSVHKDMTFQKYAESQKTGSTVRYGLPHTVVYPSVDTWRIKSNFTDLTLVNNYHLLYQAIVDRVLDTESGLLILAVNLDMTYLNNLTDNKMERAKEAFTEILKQHTINEDMKHNRCPLVVGFFEEDRIIDRTEVKIEVDEDGQMIVGMPNYIPKGDSVCYRITIGLKTDLSPITKKYLEIMVKYHDVFTAIVYNNTKKLVDLNVIEVDGDYVYDTPVDNIDTLGIFRVGNFNYRIKRS